MVQKTGMPIHHQEAEWISGQHYLTRSKMILVYLKKHRAKKDGND